MDHVPGHIDEIYCAGTIHGCEKGEAVQAVLGVVCS